MALRENERRILAEIEQHLSEDDPELADRLSSFGGDGFPGALGPGVDEWRPWLVCGVIALVVAGLLALLFLAIPGAEPESGTAPPAVPRAQALALAL